MKVRISVFWVIVLNFTQLKVEAKPFSTIFFSAKMGLKYAIIFHFRGSMAKATVMLLPSFYFSLLFSLFNQILEILKQSFRIFGDKENRHNSSLYGT